MDWHGPILTDSGGYQVMSWRELRKMDEGGVTFRSHLDGSKHRLTPERSVEIQQLLDADVTMCLDECTPFPRPSSRRRPRCGCRCAGRSAAATRSSPREGYGLFGIVQGGAYPELRAESAAR